MERHGARLLKLTFTHVHQLQLKPMWHHEATLVCPDASSLACRLCSGEGSTLRGVAALRSQSAAAPRIADGSPV